MTPIERCEAELAAIEALPRDLPLAERIGAEHGWLDWNEEKLQLQEQKYEEFLNSKAATAQPCGFEPVRLSSSLFEFQRDITRWACRRGRAAIWADCGLGKTFMELEWAREVVGYTNGKVLHLCPLAVAEQTRREGDKFGVLVNVCRSSSDLRDGINVTNYEMLHHFSPNDFAGIVLDESSILKARDGKTRKAITEFCSRIPYRLACTATPAPNDHMEIGMHAEFLGVMTAAEMLAMFFVHDGGETAVWRLKRHAMDKFWQWVASWAVLIRKPSDLGYSDEGFDLPAIISHQHTVGAEWSDGFLFPVEAKTLSQRRQARRDSLSLRVKKCADIVNLSADQWVVWCDLNDESKALAASIDGASEVTGSQDNDTKERLMEDFATGKIRVLVTKPTIAGWGLNWQHCHNMAFVGLSDSFEQLYQAKRRCWRFGQLKQVHCHVITSELEGAVVSNIERKERQYEELIEGMIDHMKELNSVAVHGAERTESQYERSVATGDAERWIAHLGDSCEIIREIPSNSIGYSIFSPPFASLYTYTNSDRDMGNCKGDEEFMKHYRFLVSELYRIIQPGRLISFHCMQLPLSKERDGVIGLKDFRGELIRVHQEAGFVYHSEVCIWKDPVTAMQRTKAIGLLHKQIMKDSCMSRQGIADYLVTMRKPGVNESPVDGKFERFIGEEGSGPKDASDSTRLSIEVWQRYASPVWMDIDPSDTLQRESAREEEDERHICPLQLQVIERGMELWSNPGDIVYSPFMGIGSEGYVALRCGRRFIGSELKRSYWEQAVKNLRYAGSHFQHTLFDTDQP